MNGSTAMFRAKGKKIVDVIEGRVEGIENVSKLRYAIKKRNFKVLKIKIIKNKNHKKLNKTI